jgi:hypothetical protein
LFTNTSFRRFPHAVRSSVAVASLVVALQGSAVLAEEAAGAQKAEPILTIIVTRHGVRSYKAPGADNSPDDKAVDKDEAADLGTDEVALNNGPVAKYKWANWNIVDGNGEIKPNDLTRHGYRLMTIMGSFYGRVLSDEGLGVKCGTNQQKTNLFVYADIDQRTLGTAHALIEGLCGSSDAAQIFHEMNPKQKDPLFNATDWASEPNEYGRNPINAREYKILPEMSAAAILASVKGDPNNQAGDGLDLAGFQTLLDERCSGRACVPLAKQQPKFKDAHPLASISGPVDTGRTWSEDVFLEYAQCGDIANPVEEPSRLGQSKPTSASDLDGLQKGLAVHVRGYAINARDDFMNNDRTVVYNPFIRGETLLWHIVALMDLKAQAEGRTARPELPIGMDATPAALDQILKPSDSKPVVIFSGHDTTLAELGGMLDAHWTPFPEANIVPDDMPPGSALVFDLLKQDGTYSVRVRFATMARERFRNEAPLSASTWKDDGVGLYSVVLGACGHQKTCDLSALEKLASDNARRGDRDIVAYAWSISGDPLAQDPRNSSHLYDPKWTKCP